MKPVHETLEDQLQAYEGRLMGLNSYVRELKDRAAEYGPANEHYEVDLTEAGHNIRFYEGEVARVKGEAGEAAQGGAAYLVCEGAASERRRHCARPTVAPSPTPPKATATGRAASTPSHSSRTRRKRPSKAGGRQEAPAPRQGR